jgi:hypothetical protein
MMSKKLIREHVEVMLTGMLNGIEFGPDVEFIFDAEKYSSDDAKTFHDILQEYNFVVTKNNRRINL